MLHELLGGTDIDAGRTEIAKMSEDRQLVAAYKHGIQLLSRTGLIEGGPEVYDVTHDGYLVADELRAAGPAALRSNTRATSPDRDGG